MLNLWGLWREFNLWRKCRAAVKFATHEDADQRAMAGLVGMPGYTALKALMITTALTEMHRHGRKSELAPGLALAVGIIAQCEGAVLELTRQLKEQKGGE